MFSRIEHEGTWTVADTVWIGKALFPKSHGSFSNIIINKSQKRNFLLTHMGKVITCLELITFLLGSKSQSLEIFLFNL